MYINVQIILIGPLMLLFRLLAWKSSYVYTVEVQTQVYNLCYINRLEVLMKVLRRPEQSCS